jgi:hypothetical protein
LSPDTATKEFARRNRPIRYDESEVAGIYQGGGVVVPGEVRRIDGGAQPSSCISCSNCSRVIL